MLKPLRDNITEFRTRIETIYSVQNEQTGALKAELKNLLELNNTITSETRNLTRALKGDSKVQGDWGEMILDSLLEHSGLQKGVHYSTQESVKDDEGRNQRPDVILSLPEGKQIIIDSKVSLTAYVEWNSAEEGAAREAALVAHVASVRKHVKELSGKRYQDLLEKAPEFDVILTAEAKSIPLAYEMSRLSGKKYLLGRKAMKVYMKDPIKYELTSITTQHKQTLYLDGEDAAQMRGRRVLIVDDVISTGESLHALEALALEAGGNIVAKMAVLAEGDAAKREDLIFLERLPLFTADGKPIA
jgi:adenine/guanine phosphoribosyltransferase-like PRPP-binding protein